MNLNLSILLHCKVFILRNNRFLSKSVTTFIGQFNLGLDSPKFWIFHTGQTQFKPRQIWEIRSKLSQIWLRSDWETQPVPRKQNRDTRKVIRFPYQPDIIKSHLRFEIFEQKFPRETYPETTRLREFHPNENKSMIWYTFNDSMSRLENQDLFEFIGFNLKSSRFYLLKLN